MEGLLQHIANDLEEDLGDCFIDDMKFTELSSSLSGQEGTISSASPSIVRNQSLENGRSSEEVVSYNFPNTPSGKLISFQTAKEIDGTFMHSENSENVVASSNPNSPLFVRNNCNPITNGVSRKPVTLFKPYDIASGNKPAKLRSISANNESPVFQNPKSSLSNCIDNITDMPNTNRAKKRAHQSNGRCSSPTKNLKGANNGRQKVKMDPKTDQNNSKIVPMRVTGNELKDNTSNILATKVDTCQMAGINPKSAFNAPMRTRPFTEQKQKNVPKPSRVSLSQRENETGKPSATKLCKRTRKDDKYEAAKLTVNNQMKESTPNIPVISDEKDGKYNPKENSKIWDTQEVVSGEKTSSDGLDIHLSQSSNNSSAICKPKENLKRKDGGGMGPKSNMNKPSNYSSGSGKNKETPKRNNGGNIKQVSKRTKTSRSSTGCGNNNEDKTEVESEGTKSSANDSALCDKNEEKQVHRDEDRNRDANINKKSSLLNNRVFGDERDPKDVRLIDYHISEQDFQRSQQTTHPVIVQCKDCDKWRTLENHRDPALFQEIDWKCADNSDEENNSCAIPGVQFDESVCVKSMAYLKFTLGSVVWAKFDNEYWPAMIDDAPGTVYYFTVEKLTSMYPVMYHVTFFGGVNPVRSWIRESDVQRFVREKHLHQKIQYHKLWYKNAVEEAQSALELPLVTRRKKYCYINRCLKRQ